MRLRPVNIKGKAGPYQPYRPVASSEILEKPTLRHLPAHEYHQGPEALEVQSACARWLGSGGTACTVMVINGAHGAGKTQLLMQSRVALERSMDACKVVHVRCRAHEQGDDGSLARRICAQLCGYDVQASLKYIIPLLGRMAAGAAAGAAAQLDAEVDAEL